ncbi:amino acid ABC transporter substrate-binding protein [Pediococcus stilesii]|uniref:Amino acid ABC transporter periplasmic protein n=1 Tax=Pediococcus stilesii TaxID=331679 RepID=A0A0R2KXQ2_9LACO|nr:amino acid ABC transporter substrate-binding protein [Pediococcus stilesii]KRN94339.1 amino acid ABC transporter periplasmic protein [Pediococcus stilesii]
MKRILKYVLVLMAILFAIPVLSGCGSSKKESSVQPSSWETIKKNKKVVIGLDDSFVPMGFRQKNGELSGYDIDLAKAVFKQYGIKADFQTIDWSMNVTELRNQTIDLIWNGLTITDERKKALTFSEPYLVNQQVLVVKKDSGITDIKGMNGKSLGAQSGSSGAQDIDDHPTILKDRIKNNAPVLYDSFNNAFIDLNANRIQGLLIDSVYANYYIKHMANSKNYRVITSGMPNEEFAVGIKKGNVQVKEKIDSAINRLRENGELKKINEKWFGK